MAPGPGDLFTTPRSAAKDWGWYYNGASIVRKREMGSSICEVKKGKSLIGYSYTVDSNRKVYHLISVFFVISTFKLHSDQK
jgi:hypothetical protein